MDEEGGDEAATAAVESARAARRAQLERRETLVGKPLVAPEPGAGRKNSAEYWEAKYDWAEKRIAELAAELAAEKERIITPEAAGICDLP
eukprot:COSAG01_NODE_67021_length_268_cov_0.704142_1_plen_89_part_11